MNLHRIYILLFCHISSLSQVINSVANTHSLATSDFSRLFSRLKFIEASRRIYNELGNLKVVPELSGQLGWDTQQGLVGGIREAKTFANSEEVDQWVRKFDFNRSGNERYIRSGWIRTSRAGHAQIWLEQELRFEKTQEEGHGRTTTAGTRAERKTHYASLRFALHMQVSQLQERFPVSRYISK